jgi:hypothetical protein
VVHCAGVTEDATVGSLDAGGIARVLAPKAAGAWHLHELAGEVPLFVLFSSAAGILGAPGQGNYAAANSVLDALASWRRARGLSGQSLAWGLWQDLSELTRHLTATDMGRIRRAGLIAMPAEQALALLDAALHTAAPALVTASLDAAALARHAHAAGSPPAAAAGAGQHYRTRPRLPRPGLRLPHRPRAPQPAHRGHQPLPAHHPHLRPPHPSRNRRLHRRQNHAEGGRIVLRPARGG